MDIRNSKNLCSSNIQKFPTVIQYPLKFFYPILMRNLRQVGTKRVRQFISKIYLKYFIKCFILSILFFVQVLNQIVLFIEKLFPTIKHKERHCRNHSLYFYNSRTYLSTIAFTTIVKKMFTGKEISNLKFANRASKVVRIAESKIAKLLNL